MKTESTEMGQSLTKKVEHQYFILSFHSKYYQPACIKKAQESAKEE